MQTEYKLTNVAAGKIKENDFLHYIKTNIRRLSKGINQKLKAQRIKKITVTLTIDKTDMIDMHDLFNGVSVQSGIINGNKNCNVYSYQNKLISTVLRNTADNCISCQVVFHEIERIFGPIPLNYVSEKNFWGILLKKAEKVWDDLIPVPEKVNPALIETIKCFQAGISYKAIDTIVITTEHE